MPDYRRKRVKKSGVRKKRVNRENQFEITTSNNKSIVPDQEIRVVRGTKYKQRRRYGILLFFVTVITLLCLILSAVLPVGLYENLVNTTALMGHGNYPIDILGDSVINTVSNSGYYYVLTDVGISAYSSNGKIALNEMHGFSNPVLSVSDTRAVVYDQGGNSLYVYNLGGKIFSLETENEIITANISRDGCFAVATHSDSYTSVVYVYNKSFKNIFTWNSAKDIVNNVLVNPSGDRLAVSTVNASAGQYTSKMLILNFESADPLYTLELDNAIALSLINTGKGISVVTADKYKFVHWSKFSTNEITSSGEINLVRNSAKGLLLVFNRANDRSDNNVVLISNKGVKSKEFKINNTITDIQYANGRIYYISDTTINILDSGGAVLRYGSCDYGAKKFAVISSNAIAAVSDTQIIKNNIEKGEN